MARAARFRVKFSRLLTRAGFSQDWYLIPLAAMVGTLAGLVATGLDWSLEHSGAFFLGFLGQQQFPYSQYLLLILLPCFGGLMVGIIQQFIARSGPSHGIPEVVEALSKRHGAMAGKLAVVKTATASLTIGTGGSAGVEGPIIMIGSVLGSIFAKTLHVGKEHMHTLVGCGAAAGMAAIFNAPIAGVMFVLEVILRDFSIKTFIPIVVASVFATAIAQSLDANLAVFSIPEVLRHYEFSVLEIGPYAILGVLCGFVGIVFMKSMLLSEKLWKASKLPLFIRPALGAGSLGVLGVIFVLMGIHATGEHEPPAFYGNGYKVIEMLLDPVSYEEAGLVQSGSALDTEQIGVMSSDAAVVAPSVPEVSPTAPPLSATMQLLLIIVVFKLLGTCLTLGSGGSGGILAPCLFMGAALGGCFGLAMNATGLLPQFDPATYALAGMAGVIAAMVHCPLTAFLLVFEMTQNYKFILPVMVVAILATVCSQFFVRDSIYATWTRKKFGVHMGSTADLTLLRRHAVGSVPLVPAVIVHPQEPVQRLIELAEDYAAVDFAVCDEQDCYLGMVVGEDLRTTLLQREAIPLMIVSELMRTNLPTVQSDETLDTVLDKFARHEMASLAVVNDTGEVKGLISRTRLMRYYQQVLSR